MAPSQQQRTMVRTPAEQQQQLQERKKKKTTNHISWEIIAADKLISRNVVKKRETRDEKRKNLAQSFHIEAKVFI